MGRAVGVALALIASASLSFAPHAMATGAETRTDASPTAIAAPSTRAVGTGAPNASMWHANRSLPTGGGLQWARHQNPRSVKHAKAPPGLSRKRASFRRVAWTPPRLSFGALHGLQNADDALALKSSAAIVLDQDTGEVLFSKNERAVLPVASLTKLMTALVVLEAKQPLDQLLQVTDEAFDTEKRTRSRLVLGASLSRIELMHLALMASENRAAHTLGANYPGGPDAFVAAMNRRANELGMTQSKFVEPTGLSSRNQSSARDLAMLVKAAHQHRTIRDLSTSHGLDVEVAERAVHFRNTNGLIASPIWDIGLQKTGYISEAGRCLVMQAKLAGRKLVMVFLDSAGKHSRLGDAERVRRWLMQTASAPLQPTTASATPPTEAVAVTPTAPES